MPGMELFFCLALRLREPQASLRIKWRIKQVENPPALLLGLFNYRSQTAASCQGIPFAHQNEHSPEKTRSGSIFTVVWLHLGQEGQRSLEWFWLEWTLRATQLQPLPWAGCLPPAQAAWGPSNLSVVGAPQLSGQLCRGLTALWVKNFLLKSNLNLFSFKVVPPLSYHYQTVRRWYPVYELPWNAGRLQWNLPRAFSSST